ncbi:uncharacterized protein L969DRAFT_621012 [Mixia osmundae IAM 14324]|uniref:uncharacterized protein n=1 Tax=Mixia osmundae (strain CBS 9802 / IAM 14324 / JCM 22182 / KY 12970) TaxID=764103 RepID=UPI0004A5563B|nr:uncharacterized protein L969DRAFT_621012 [Mixia osmundae IAM 14324]KEI40350.1 hypothetical protein L969DRAFT_621012 [Mixia osmundae IAM 14324]
MAAPLYSTESGLLWHAGCVGLPARGKTHVSHSLERYLRWLGVRTEVFSLGDYRREVLGPSSMLPSDYFSDAGNRTPETEKLRLKVKDGLESEIMKFFEIKRGQVAIYDANNGTKAQRQNLRAKFEAIGVHIMFIEMVCERKEIIEANIRAVKLSSPDYRGWNPDAAVRDYWRRIADHEKKFETIEQPSFPYVKVINVGERIIVNNISGYLQSRIVFFLMNIHNRFRTVWFARSGKSVVEHSYKADSGLSEEGEEYAEKLASFIIQTRKQLPTLRRQAGDTKTQQRDLTVWTSARKRCIETTMPFQQLGYRVVAKTQMIEINPGVIDGLSPEEIQQKYPEEHKKSLETPYAHRYPRAESFHDLSVRLEPVIFELEREPNDLLCIGHASVLRCLFAYLKGLAPQDIPKIDLKRGDVIEVTPTAYGVSSKTHRFWSARGDPLTIGDESFQYGSPAKSLFSFADQREKQQAADDDMTARYEKLGTSENVSTQ